MQGRGGLEIFCPLLSAAPDVFSFAETAYRTSRGTVLCSYDVSALTALFGCLCKVKKFTVAFLSISPRTFCPSGFYAN